MKCPNCRTEMESTGYDEAHSQNNYEIIHSWEYQCPDCKKHWVEEYIYKCISHTVEEDELV